MGDTRNIYRIFMGKPLGECPLRRPRRRWEGNINMNLMEVGCKVGRLIELTQDCVQWQC